MTFIRTKNHAEIQTWIEERAGIPVSLPEGNGEQIAVYFGQPPLPEGYEAISWDDFFERFDVLNFAFKYPLPDAEAEERLSYQFATDTDDSFYMEEQLHPSEPKIVLNG
jgi:hypothetical protein